MKHYFVSIGTLATDFSFFSNESRMFEWIGKSLGFACKSYVDIEWWNKNRIRNCIEIYEITNLKWYLTFRKLYMKCIDYCNSFMSKAQRTTTKKKRTFYLSRFQIWNDNAWHLAENHVGVWQGEI